MRFPFSFSRPAHVGAGIMLFASLWGLQAWAQEQHAAAPMQSVQVTGARVNPAPFAELEYGGYIRDYSYLRKQLPQESRLIEMWEVFRYASMSLAQQDAYTPPHDGIAIVSQSVKATVPVRRGGYFILPQVEQAYLEEGTIQVRQAIDRQYHTMYIAFSLQLGADQRTSYADLARHRGRSTQSRARSLPITRACNISNAPSTMPSRPVSWTPAARFWLPVKPSPMGPAVTARSWGSTRSASPVAQRSNSRARSIS